MRTSQFKLCKAIFTKFLKIRTTSSNYTKKHHKNLLKKSNVLHPHFLKSSQNSYSQHPNGQKTLHKSCQGCVPFTLRICENPKYNQSPRDNQKQIGHSPSGIEYFSLQGRQLDKSSLFLGWNLWFYGRVHVLHHKHVPFENGKLLLFDFFKKREASHFQNIHKWRFQLFCTNQTIFGAHTSTRRFFSKVFSNCLH